MNNTNILHIKNKTLLFLLATCICFSLLPFSVSGSDDTSIIEISNSSKAYAIYLYNVNNDSAIFEKNVYKKISPASTVKLMTAIVAYENISDIDQSVIITDKMIGDVKSNTMKLQIGEKIKIADLFAGLVCSGYNDAANVLAVISSGSVTDFVNAMNAKACELGALDTLYVDPTGIDDSAQTTAFDTMLIAKEFMSYDYLLATSSSTSIVVPKTNMSEARTLYNRNAMISNRSGSRYLNSCAIGMNAGMTSGGGYCVVTSMKQEDMCYICVVMGAKYVEDTDTVYSYVIAGELLTYIDENLGYMTVLSTDEELGSLPIIAAKTNKTEVSLSANEDIRVYLPYNYLETKDFKISYVYFNDELTAPVTKGDVVGKIIVRYKDDIVCVKDIIVNEDVPRNSFLYTMKRIRNVVFSRGAVATLICFAILISGYIIIEHNKTFYRRKRFRKNINKYR